MTLTKTGKFFLFAIPMTLVGGYLIYRRIRGQKLYNQALIPTSIPRIPTTTGSSTTPTSDPNATPSQTSVTTTTGSTPYEPTCLDLLIQTDLLTVIPSASAEDVIRYNTENPSEHIDFVDDVLANYPECGYRKYEVVTLISDSVNKREAPSLTAKIVGQAYKGKIYVGKASDVNGWIELMQTYTQDAGFVSADYLKAV